MHDEKHEKALIVLIRRARDVLKANWQGNYTAPSVKQYPHQWSWDSGFITIGYSYFDEMRAKKELSSLLKAQWTNGMVPHIRYNPRYEHYFPDASFWHPLPDCAPEGVNTSCITQPPLATIGAFYFYINAVDMEEAKRFLKHLYPRLLGFHRFLYKERDPDGKDLVAIVHPWESGMDDSPAWKDILMQIDIPSGIADSYRRQDTLNVPAEERPEDEIYFRYIYLAELFKKEGYRQHRVVRRSPFLVYDVLFNSLLCRANECLIEIGRIVGEDTAELKEYLAATRRAIEKWLWNEEAGLYFSYDARSNAQIEKPSVASFSPLFAGVPGYEQAERLYAYIDGVCQCSLEESNSAVPSYPRCEEDFRSDRYWMGPVWANMNWIVYEGLKRYGYHHKALDIKESMLKLISRYGFYEYFDPIKNKGCGAKDFSWTAALTIAMCCD